MDMKAILDRMRKITGTRFDKDLAAITQMTQADFSNRKKRGTLIPVLLKWAEEEGIDAQWLLYGIGQPRGLSKKLAHILGLGETMSVSQDEALLLLLLRELPPEQRKDHAEAIRKDYLRWKK